MNKLWQMLGFGSDQQLLEQAKKDAADTAAKLHAVGQTQAIIEFDPAGNILEANSNFLQVMGYEQHEIVGRHHSIFVEPNESNGREYTDFWQALRRGEERVAEFKRLAKGNREVWIHGSYCPLKDDQNQVYKVVKFARDITAEKLRQADAAGQIKAINKSQAVIEFNMDGTIISANDNFLAVMGYTLEEIAGHHHRMFVEPQLASSEEYRYFWERLNRGEYASAEYKRLAKGGKAVWIQASYNPVFDSTGRPFKVVKYATDVTAEKLKNADFTGQLAAIDKAQAVISFNMDGTIIDANSNFLQTVGYRIDEVKGKHHSMFVEPAERASASYRQFWDALNRGEFLVSQYKRVGAGGREIWLQASYNPILDLNGKPFKVVKFATDISEDKRQEAENRRVANLAGALQVATSNVMLADDNFNIVYLNDSALDMFRNRETQLRQVLPAFDSRTLIGRNIDVFHKNPSHNRHVVEGLKSSLKTEIGVNGLTFGLTASPWLGVDGERIGTIVEWVDRTAEVELEKEIGLMVQAAGSGDFTRQIQADGKSGFFKNLSDGLNQLSSTIEVALNDIMRMLGAMAKGDLSERITREYDGSFAQLKQDANATAEKLTDIIGKITMSSTAILSAANEIAQGNLDLSQRTENQASSLEQTASSMEEMTSTVKQSSENAQKANELSDQAQAKAREGGEVVKRAVLAMEEINSSSKKISDIIGVIDEIAFQTNLLALNAAVEAARAGEQGRGFAVVAGEVRNLAQRSAGAAKEIKDLIRDSVGKVQDGRELVNASGNTLEEIVSAVESVSLMMREIAEASREQTSGIEQVNVAISQMDEMTQQNAALVEQATAAGSALADQANSMNAVVEFFNVGAGAGASVGGGQPMAPAARPAAKTTQRPASRPAAKPSAVDDDEWEEF